METDRTISTGTENKFNRKNFIAVCAALFLLLFGTYISGTLLVPYTESLGGTGLTIGIVYSCMYAVRLVFGTPIGRLSQRIGAKKILTYSLGLFPLIAIAYWVSWNIPSLLFSRLLHGVASAMLLPMAMAYIGEVSPEGQEGRYMSIYNSLLFAASAFGPLAGGLIYDKYGVRAAFVVLFGLAALSFVLISTLAGGWKGRTSGTSDPKISSESAQVQPIRKLLANKRLLALGSVNISMAVLLALYGASFTQYALSRKMGMGEVGMLIAAINIVIGISQIPFGRFVDRHNKAVLTTVSGVAAALLSACMPFVKGLWPILALAVLSGIFISLNLAAFSALSTLEGREAGMGNTMGFLGTATSAGTIIGYLLLGLVTDVFGVNMSFYISSLVFLAGLAAFIVLWPAGNRLNHGNNITV
jgi:MFS transporter, DHA1 family, multidrug resistance protein